MIHVKFLVPPAQLISESTVSAQLDKAITGKVDVSFAYDTRVPQVWALITGEAA